MTLSLTSGMADVHGVHWPARARPRAFCLDKRQRPRDERRCACLHVVDLVSPAILCLRVLHLRSRRRGLSRRYVKRGHMRRCVLLPLAQLLSVSSFVLIALYLFFVILLLPPFEKIKGFCVPRVVFSLMFSFPFSNRACRLYSRRLHHCRCRGVPLLVCPHGSRLALTRR